MPIAPIPTVSDAVTKPLMNWLSLSFPDLCLSHAPNLWKRPSMSIISPMSVPEPCAESLEKAVNVYYLADESPESK